MNKIKNTDIKASKVMLVEETGTLDMSLSEALELANERGLDLVQVSEKADCAICKIMDYSKYKYEYEKALRKNNAKNRANRVDLKEIRVSWKIGDHDLETKINNIHRIVDKNGDKVKVVIQFKGREVAMIDHGYKIADKIKGIVHNLKCSDTKREGNNLVFTIEHK